jgi:hypothetical protein
MIARIGWPKSEGLLTAAGDIGYTTARSPNPLSLLSLRIRRRLPPISRPSPFRDRSR